MSKISSQKELEKCFLFGNETYIHESSGNGLRFLGPIVQSYGGLAVDTGFLGAQREDALDKVIDCGILEVSWVD